MGDSPFRSVSLPVFSRSFHGSASPSLCHYLSAVLPSLLSATISLPSSPLFFLPLSLCRPPLSSFCHHLSAVLPALLSATISVPLSSLCQYLCPSLFCMPLSMPLSLLSATISVPLSYLCHYLCPAVFSLPLYLSAVPLSSLCHYLSLLSGVAGCIFCRGGCGPLIVYSYRWKGNLEWSSSLHSQCPSNRLSSIIQAEEPCVWIFTPTPPLHLRPNPRPLPPH